VIVLIIKIRNMVKRRIFKLLSKKKYDKFIKFRGCRKSLIKLSTTENIEILILSIFHQPVHRK